MPKNRYDVWANEPARVEMTISPETEELLKGSPFFLEVEMLFGVSKKLEDGRIHYEIWISDPDKQAVMKAFLLEMMFINRTDIEN